MATRELVLSLRTAFDGAGLEKASRSLDAIKIASAQVDGALAGLDSVALKAARSAAELALAEDRVAKSTAEAAKAVAAVNAAHTAAASATAGDTAATDAYNRAVKESSVVIATLQRDTDALARLKLRDVVASEQQAAAAQKAADAQVAASAKAVAAAEKQAIASERAAAAAKRAAEAPKGGGGGEGGSFGGGSVFNALYSPPVLLAGATLYGGFKAGQSYSQLQTDTASAVSTSTSSQADLAYYKTAIPALAKQQGGRFTADQLAQALFPIVSNGLSGKAAINALSSVADFSYAGGLSQKTAIDPATAASALAIGYTAYGKTLTPSQIANIDFSTIQAGGAAASDVVTQSGKYLGVAANAGVSAVDASGVFASLSRTLTPDISGLYTKDLIQNLTTPTKTQLAAGKAGGIELGPDAFSAANGGLAGQLDRIRRDVAGLSNADRGAYLTALGGSAIGGQTLGALVGTSGAYANYVQARGAVTDKGAIGAAENIIDASPQAQLDKSFKTLSDDITLKLGKDIDSLTPAAVRAVTALDALGNVTYDKVFGGFGNALDAAVKNLHILVDHPETGTSAVIGAGARDAIAAGLGTITGGRSSSVGSAIAGIQLPGGNTLGGLLSATGAAADKAVGSLPGTYNYDSPPSSTPRARAAATRANGVPGTAAGTNGDDPRVVYAPRNPITDGSFIPGLGGPSIVEAGAAADRAQQQRAQQQVVADQATRHAAVAAGYAAAQAAQQAAAANATTPNGIGDFLHPSNIAARRIAEANSRPVPGAEELGGREVIASAKQAADAAKRLAAVHGDDQNAFALAQLTVDPAAARKYGDALIRDELASTDSASAKALLVTQIQNEIKAVQASATATAAATAARVQALAVQTSNEALRGATITYNQDTGNNAPLSVLNRDSAAIRGRADAASRRNDVGANAYLLPNDLRQNALDQAGRDRTNSTNDTVNRTQDAISAASQQLQAAQFNRSSSAKIDAAAEKLYKATLTYDQTITSPRRREVADRNALLTRNTTDRSGLLDESTRVLGQDQARITYDANHGIPTVGDVKQLGIDEKKYASATGKTALDIANELFALLPHAIPRLAPTFAPSALDPGIEAGRGSATFRTGVYARDTQNEEIALLRQQVSYQQQTINHQDQELRESRQQTALLQRLVNHGEKPTPKSSVQVGAGRGKN